MSTCSRKGPAGCKPAPTLEDCPWGETSQTKSFVLRLLPGMALKQSLLMFCDVHKISSASISTCVGSLTRATLRMADSQTVRQAPWQ